MRVVVLEGAVDVRDVEIKLLGDRCCRFAGLLDEAINSAYGHPSPIDVGLVVKFRHYLD
jgi:hypothetical protein